MADNEETVTITKKEYDELLERDRWLCALEAAGLDNWEGCEQAVDILDEWDSDLNPTIQWFRLGY